MKMWLRICRGRKAQGQLHLLHPHAGPRTPRPMGRTQSIPCPTYQPPLLPFRSPTSHLIRHLGHDLYFCFLFCPICEVHTDPKDAHLPLT